MILFESISAATSREGTYPHKITRAESIDLRIIATSRAFHAGERTSYRSGELSLKTITVAPGASGAKIALLEPITM